MTGDRTFAVNLRAAAILCAQLLPAMQARGFGRIINISSEAGVAIVPGLAAYSVSKHALVALTEVIQNGNHENGTTSSLDRRFSSARCATR